MESRRAGDELRTMAPIYDLRRYLTDFDSSRAGNILTDVLVIGSGVAGARAAIEAAEFGLVVLMTKGRFDESTTSYAQGGIAAAVGPGDSPDQHFQDTMTVGCGLNDPKAVRLLVHEGPQRIEELLHWGARFDREKGSLSLGREGGHRVNRIVHAQGDQTGRELTRVVTEKIRRMSSIRVFEHCFLLDFITVDGRCIAATTFHPRHGHQLIWAKQTILASGGCGQIWRETTNPPTATGDGLAAAFRAGAELFDMEFMQFHPTTLYLAGAGRHLISEAVRGEGAHLVDRHGERFMHRFHPDAELAPRDVVSRAIHRHLLSTRSPCVYLDVRHLDHFAERFPHIANICADFSIDLRKDRIPVRPTAHYLVGGVRTNPDATTGVTGLLACGEVAASGVHGANRIASNSLLEGLVFGRIAGETAGRRAADDPRPPAMHPIRNRNDKSARTELDLGDIGSSLRSLMWRNVGIERRGDRLEETQDILDFWGHYTLDKTFDDPDSWIVQNELTVARAVARSALERTESVGVHFRSDGGDSTAASPYHVVLRRTDGGLRIERMPHA